MWRWRRHTRKAESLSPLIFSFNQWTQRRRQQSSVGWEFGKFSLFSSSWLGEVWLFGHEDKWQLTRMWWIVNSAKLNNRKTCQNLMIFNWHIIWMSTHILPPQQFMFCWFSPIYQSKSLFSFERVLPERVLLFVKNVSNLVLGIVEQREPKRIFIEHRRKDNRIIYWKEENQSTGNVCWPFSDIIWNQWISNNSTALLTQNRDALQVHMCIKKKKLRFMK